MFPPSEKGKMDFCGIIALFNLILIQCADEFY